MAKIKPKGRAYDNSGIRSFSLKYANPDGSSEGGGFGYRSIIECFDGIAKQKDWDMRQGKIPRIVKSLGRDAAGNFSELVIWIDGAFVHEPRVTAFLGNELLDVEDRLRQMEEHIRKASEVFTYNGVKY